MKNNIGTVGVAGAGGQDGGDDVTPPPPATSLLSAFTTPTPGNDGYVSPVDMKD